MCIHICAVPRVWGSEDNLVLGFLFPSFSGLRGFTLVAKLTHQAPFEPSHWSWSDLLKGILGIQQRMVWEPVHCHRPPPMFLSSGTCAHVQETQEPLVMNESQKRLKNKHRLKEETSLAQGFWEQLLPNLWPKRSYAADTGAIARKQDLKSKSQKPAKTSEAACCRRSRLHRFTPGINTNKQSNSDLWEVKRRAQNCHTILPKTLSIQQNIMLHK